MNTKALRQKVLDLAIHGKLVPQNPNDESAEKLLKKIREERADKIKKGELKADKKDSFIFVGSDKRHYEQFADGTIKDIEDEIPFEVPEGWAWCRLFEISTLKGGKRIPAGLSATKTFTKHIYIRVTDMKNNSISDDDLVYIDDSIFEKIKQYTINKTDLYLTIAGTIGRVGEVPEKFDGMNLTENALKLTNIYVNKRYLMFILNSSFVQDYFESTYHQVAMPKLSLINASKALLPIPPKNEQDKIVIAIEKAFELITYLEQNKSDLQDAIKQAKSKILDLAIHGKLVPQDSNDEPAEELLKRIATSDNRPYRKLEEDESETNIPIGWNLCKLKDICTDFIVPQRDKPKVFGGNIPWCRIEDIEGKYLNGSLSGQLVTEETIRKMNMHKCPVGSIICSCSASLGIQAITTVECCTNQTFIGIVPNNSALFNEYLYYLLKAQTKYFHEIATGTTIKYISREKFEELLIILPPLQEQYRIVAKIEKLFSQLDTILVQLS